MKSIIIVSIALLLQACSSNSTSDKLNTEPAKDSTKVTATTPQVANVDANTGATSKNSSMINGTMIVPAENNITITLPMGGTITQFTHLPGDLVKKGSVIAVLENTEFIALQQSYLESASQMENLETEYNRQKALASADATSQKRLQQSKSDYLSMKSRKDAATSQLNLLGVNASQLATNGIVNRLTVRAPRNGYVSDIMVNQGKYVAAGQPICSIIDKSKILLNLIAYEKDLERIKIGQKIEFKVNGLGDDVFEAVISTIDQQVDPVNRSVKVFAKVISKHNDFRPGMYVIANVKQ